VRRFNGGGAVDHSNHALYETLLGIPQMVARIEDCIFEGLPDRQAREWPERFGSAIKPGADLSRVGWQFLHWIVTDAGVNPGIEHPIVRDAVRQCADVLAQGECVDRVAALSAASAAESAVWSAAESAAWSAANAAWSAANAAWSAASAASAANAAESAARSAARAAWSAEHAASAAAFVAEGAAWSAVARAARSAAERGAAGAAWRAAERAVHAARSAAYVRMADSLVDLLEAA
jgi:hypothetical protein